MTAAWLGDVLGQPGRLKGFTAARVGTGQMCDSYRLALDWEDGVAATASVVAKCPSHDEASRNIAKLTGTYVKEVSWYRELAAGPCVAEARCRSVEHPTGLQSAMCISKDIYCLTKKKKKK